MLSNALLKNSQTDKRKFRAGEVTYYTLVASLGVGVLALAHLAFVEAGPLPPKSMAGAGFSLVLLHAIGMLLGWILYAALLFDTAEYEKSPSPYSGGNTKKMAPSWSFYLCVASSFLALLATVLVFLFIGSFGAGETIAPSPKSDAEAGSSNDDDSEPGEESSDLE